MKCLGNFSDDMICFQFLFVEFDFYPQTFLNSINHGLMRLKYVICRVMILRPRDLDEHKETCHNYSHRVGYRCEYM